MKKIIIFLFPIWFHSTYCLSQPSTTVRNEILSCWRTLDHRFLPAYGLKKSEIARFSKQTICFNTKVVAMYGDTLFRPTYSMNKYRANDYLWGSFQSKKEDIGITTDSLYEIILSGKIKLKSDSKLHNMEYTMLYDGVYLFIFQDGVVFRLINKPVKTTGRSSG
jgi:hypothetical protein